MKNEQKMNREALLNGDIQKLAESRPGMQKLMPDDVRQKMVQDTIANAPDKSEFRVFAYGSLIWNPALEIESTYPCSIDGFHRSFCFWTVMGRGSEDMPGLMMGLESGGSCDGVAYSIAPDKIETELDILFRREMLSYIYKPTWVKAKYRDSKTTAGTDMLTFVVDTESDRFCCERDDATMVKTLATAEGPLGKNCDYLYQLVEHLEALGYKDQNMTELARKVRSYQAQH